LVGRSAVERSTTDLRQKRRLRGVVIVAIAATFIACSTPDARGPGQSTEQQSVAEYDVAKDLWLQRGQPRPALAHALTAIELDEDNADAHHLAALIYLDFCRFDPNECRLEEAERHARAALELRSDFREARNTLGVVLIHLKRYRESIEVLQPLTVDILYQTPENAWGNLGLAYLELGDSEHAIEALKRSTAAQPDFCVGHYRLGLAYEKLQRNEEAVGSFTKAIEAGGGRCQGLQVAYAGRARVLEVLRRTAEARNDLDTCVRLDKRTDAGRECQALRARIP
jgi:Tfp pilus assembly protein PilF